MTDEGMTPAVTLRPMNAVEFEPWRELSIRNHATQMAKATGVSFEQAEEKARQLLPRVLPQGLQTQGMHFLVIVSNAEGDVGSLWLGPHPEDSTVGYVYDIEIHDEFRGLGLGHAAMLAAEDFMRQRDTAQLGLWVAGGNDIARSLYDSLGYRVVGTSMSKRLSP